MSIYNHSGVGSSWLLLDIIKVRDLGIVGQVHRNSLGGRRLDKGRPLDSWIKSAVTWLLGMLHQVR